MKYYTYKDLGIASTKKPFNTHLFVEASDGDLYMVDSANQRVLLKSTKTRLLIDGSDWTTIATRDNEIRSLWNDRTNGYIYLLDCDNSNNSNDIDVAYINLSNDSVNDLGTLTATALNKFIAYDIYIITGTVYISVVHTGIGGEYVRFYSVDDPGFTLIDSNLDDRGILQIPSVIHSGIAYWVVSTYFDKVQVRSFEPSAGVAAYQQLYESSAGIILPTDTNLRGLAYDGSDFLYFITKNKTSGKHYLTSYVISTNTFTILGEQNVALMLDRNTASGVFEKAFHITDFRAYRIGYNSSVLYKIFDGEISTNTIIAISDNFMFVDNAGTIELWEPTDISNDIKEVIIDTKTGQISTADVITTETIATGLTIEIFDDSDNLQFNGLAYKRNSKDGKEFIYKCVGYDKEISRKFTASFNSKTAKQIMQYILDGDMNGDGTATVSPTSFLYYSSSIDNDGSFTATYTLSFNNKTIKEIYDTLMDFEDGEWYIAPDGKVYAYALVDIPSTGETITQDSNKVYGEPPEISQMMWELNKISLYGAIVSGARLQNEAGYGEDIPSQQVNGVNEFLRHYPHVDSQALINSLANAILARTGLTNNPIYIIISFKEIGFEQVGKTLNFQFTPYTDLAIATDYYILGQVYYAKQDIATLILSSGLIQEGREHEATLNQTSDADEEQIDILAGVAGAGGETNTASNQGTDGVGVFDTKAGVDLQFRHIAPVNAKLTVVLNGKDIDLTVVVGNTADTVCVGNDARLSDSRTPLAHILGTTGPHTGALPWTDLNKTGSSLADLATRAHSNLSDAPTSAHHVRYADSEAVAAIETDDNIYTKTEVDAHNWLEGDITDLNKYTQAEVDALVGAGKDTTAYHDNVVGEIFATAVKNTPVGADLVVIEDSAASWAKKRVVISTLLGVHDHAQGEIKPNIINCEATEIPLTISHDADLSIIFEVIAGNNRFDITSAGIRAGGTDARITEFDSDVNLAGGDTKVPTDLAVKTYVDAHNWLEADITDLDKYTQAQVDAHNWLEADITDLDHDAVKIKGVTVDDADKANNKILKYNSTSGNLEYEIDDTGAGFAPPIGFIAMFSGSWTDNSTIPGWYKCDGNNGTPNLVDKFIRGAATSGATGGSDDAVVVSHSHGIKGRDYTNGQVGIDLKATDMAGTSRSGFIYASGVSGVGANKPAYYALIFIMRIS